MVSYEPLYRLLRERSIMVQSLSEKIGFKKGTLATNLSHHRHMSTDTISKICEVLGCRPEDIFEFTDTEPEHKRIYIRKDWQYDSDEYVVVKWEKVCADIKSQGYSEAGFSKKMGKDTAYFALRKNRKYTKKTVIKEIADFLGKSFEEYI